jgi:CheY-like chemotaxis protein
MALVLVIDDTPQVRRLLRLTLELAGHRVREAAGGKEGLRLLGREPADLVFCDVFMPGMDGLETMRELRRGHPGVPVVAMSGGSEIAFDAHPVAVALGAAVVLRKPFGRAEALAAAEEALAGGRQS